MVFETERLILRPWEETDAEECYKYAKDDRVGPAAGWPVHTSVENSRQIIRDVLMKPEIYAIVWKETGLPIGSIGLHRNDLAVKEDEMELGYWLGVPYWGRGIAPEAAEALLRHAFADLGLQRVWCGYYDGNDKSRRVQEKLGFRHQWSTENLPVPQMGETRTGHVNLMTHDEWLQRSEAAVTGRSAGGSPAKDEPIEAAMTFVRSLFAGNADGHDAAHTLRVYRNAMAIADGESCDRMIVALAALLHDADDHKLFETEDNANARAFLHARGLDEDTVGRIIAAINSVSFSENGETRPDTTEGRIVQDADRLDAVGAIGIARTFAYGGRHDRGLEDSIRHFHEKLLLLKDRMNTAKGKELAEDRHAFLLSFLREWEREMAE